MKVFRCIVFFTVLTACLIFNSITAQSRSTTELDRFRNPPEEHERAITHVTAKYLTNEPYLYGSTIAAAVSDENDVAFFSTPAPDEGFNRAFAVYDEDGVFQYGYELFVEYGSRLRVLFFIESTPYVYLSVYRTVYAFDPSGAGIVSTYSGSAQELRSALLDFEINGMWNNVCVSPKADVKLVNYTNGELTIMDSSGNVINIFDRSEDNKRIEKAIPFWVPLALLSLLIVMMVYHLHHEKNNGRLS